MNKFVCLVSVGMAVFSASANPEVEYLEFVETTGYEYADTGISPNPARTRVRANFQVIETTEKADGLVAVFGCTPKKGTYDGYDNCTFFYGWNNGYSQWRVRPRWVSGSDTDSAYYVNGFSAREGMEIECYKATGYVNGTKVGGYYDDKRPDKTLDCSLYIGNVNNANEGVVTAAGHMAKIRWYRFEIWTDGELVADFVAARKGEDVGFYDQVNGGFITSAVAGKPFLAPKHVEWTGLGSNSDPADGANWKGGVAPTTGDTAYIPSGHTLTSNYAQVEAFFNNLDGVTFEDETTGLMLTNGDRTATMKCPLYGKGRFTVANSLCTSSASQTLTIQAANYMFAGTMLVTNAAVLANTGGNRCAHTPAGPNGTVVIYNANRSGTSDRRRYTIQSGEQTCKYVIRRAKGEYFIVHEAVKFTGDIDLNELTEAVFHGNSGYTMSFYGDVAYTQDVRKAISIQSGQFGFEGGEQSPKHLGLLQVATGNTPVYAPLMFSPQAKDADITKQYNLAVGTFADATTKGLAFGLADALPRDAFVLFNNGQEIASGKHSLVNLNGFDQRIGTLGVFAKSDFDPGTTWNGRFVICSDSPATLTIYGNCRCDAASAKHVYPGVVNGAVSVTLDSQADINVRSVDGEVGMIRFNCPGSDTTGMLAAKNGTIEVMSTASFENVAAIVASDDGVIKVGTSAIGTAREDFLVSVTNAATAKVEIDAGVTLTCDTAFMGGRWLTAGDYSSKASSGVDACSRLAGDGILRVRRFGGKRGMMLILR